MAARLASPIDSIIDPEVSMVMPIVIGRSFTSSNFTICCGRPSSNTENSSLVSSAGAWPSTVV